VPRYADIAGELAERIAAEGRVAGERIESEHDLTREFEVSRGTVVRAMELLERQGIVHRVQGRGTFVLGRPALRSANQLVSFTEHVEATGGVAGGRVLGWREVTWSAKNPLHRPFAARTRLVDFSRLRMIDGVPVGTHRVVVARDLAATIDLLERFNGPDDWSLYAAMADAGVHLGRSDEQFSAVLADDEEASILGVKQPCALLRVERHTYDLVGRPIEVVDARYLSERYTVTAESIRSRQLNRRSSPRLKEAP
jgi:DNA-binding GntR family transcriptional regulator